MAQTTKEMNDQKGESQHDHKHGPKLVNRVLERAHQISLAEYTQNNAGLRETFDTTTLKTMTQFRSNLSGFAMLLSMECQNRKKTIPNAYAESEHPCEGSKESVRSCEGNLNQSAIGKCQPKCNQDKQKPKRSNNDKNKNKTSRAKGKDKNRS